MSLIQLLINLYLLQFFMNAFRFSLPGFEWMSDRSDNRCLISSRSGVSCSKNICWNTLLRGGFDSMQGCLRILSPGSMTRRSCVHHRVLNKSLENCWFHLDHWSVSRLSSLISVLEPYNVIFSLQELEEFIAEAEAGLQEEVVAGDYDALVRVMAKLVAVRDRQQVSASAQNNLWSNLTLLGSITRLGVLGSITGLVKFDAVACGSPPLQFSFGAVLLQRRRWIPPLVTQSFDVIPRVYWRFDFWIPLKMMKFSNAL